MTDEQLFQSVLLIEDDSSHALLIKRALKNFVSDITIAETVQEGLGHLRSRDFALVLSDLNLPDAVNGNHVQQIAELAPFTPLVVLTSSTALTDAISAMRSGARDFIVKDFGQSFREVLGLALTRLYGALLLEEERLKLAREIGVLKVAIENSVDGLAVADENGEIEYANQSFFGFCRWCSGGASDVSADDSEVSSSGQSVASHWNLLSLFGDAVHQGESLQNSLEHHFQSLEPGGVWTTEVAAKDDPTHCYELSLSMVSSGEEQSSHVAHNRVVWVTDVSEAKKREKFQREILSTTTHDLKGPLGAVLLSSELLTECTEKGSRPYEIALRVGSSAQGALNLIDEFLSARRIQEGTFVLKPASFPFQGLAGEVLENYESIALASRITLDSDIPENLMINADRMGLSRVLGNLVSNALKFSGRDASVTVRGREVPGGSLIEVEDTGMGMAPADARRIFERYSRLNQHHNISGSGLGLFIVKSVVSAHGGSIDVRSQEGRGTCFSITLPDAPPINEHGELIVLDF